MNARPGDDFIASTLIIGFYLYLGRKFHYSQYSTGIVITYNNYIFHGKKIICNIFCFRKLLPIQVFLNRKDASRPNQAEIGGLSQDGGLSQGGGLGQEGGISQGGGLSQDGGLSQGGGHILNDGDTDGGQIQKDGHDQELGPSSRRKCKKPSHKLSVNYWRTKYMNNKASVKHFQSYLRAAKSTIRKQNTWKPAAAIFSNAQLRRLSNPASRSPWNQDSVAKALALSPSLPKLMVSLLMY
ncbi:uncharacterized protein LOC121875663 [Homarus americanus]|uniref:uncharacterized protein LOC121875663 n=1 Tax=Homarus americanus TaxID=6706 RepID=UPI001C45F797|nr:uncharacterized protein LOC121875663 [Homarus americanus]